jgi:uncharacterized protein
MRIAVLGTGISGMLAAHLLSAEHEVTVFEAADRLGGHTHTVQLELDGRRHAVDTGFIVFNDWTYPNFIRLLEHLQVPSQVSEMSFSVRSEVTGLEYNGHSLDTLFAQRRNLVRPRFLGMLRDILRFNRMAGELLDLPDGDAGPTLGDYLARRRFGSAFTEDYILPMGGAIWSASASQMLLFPAKYFVRFFSNHGMLSVDQRPTWRVLVGGSRSYIAPLTAPYAERIHLSAPVQSLARDADGVTVQARGRPAERFDAAVVAAHADQALAMLADPSDAERQVLSAFTYQENQTVLHTDERLMPRAKRAWAAWNFHQLGRSGEEHSRVAVSYYMNRLQTLEAPPHFLVTLNHTAAIRPECILRRLTYHHPVYTHGAVAAQKRRSEINGPRKTWYCGAYWGYGFHEDGVNSALAVAKDFGIQPW